MLSCVCGCVCADVNQRGTNRNRCTQRLVILHAHRPKLTNELWLRAKKQVSLVYSTGQDRGLSVTAHGQMLVRPPDIHVVGLIFYHGFFFLSFFLLLSFFRRLISELAERDSMKIGHMVGSKCNLKTHIQNLGVQIGGPKTTFFDDFGTSFTLLLHWRSYGKQN